MSVEAVMQTTFLAVVLLFRTAAAVLSAADEHQTLIVLKDESLRTTHSQFFELLKNRNHNITFATTATNVALHNVRIFAFAFLNVVTIKNVAFSIMRAYMHTP